MLDVLLPHGKPRVKASHENPFAMGWIPFHGPCCRCCCTDLHRQDRYGRSDSITGLSCICQKVQALNFFNLKMRTPSSINGKLFKPTSVTCWDSSQLQELQKMKLPLLFSSIVAICLAGPQYLRNYGISSNLRSQSYSRNFAIQSQSAA